MEECAMTDEWADRPISIFPNFAIAEQGITTVPLLLTDPQIPAIPF